MHPLLCLHKVGILQRLFRSGQQGCDRAHAEESAVLGGGILRTQGASLRFVKFVTIQLRALLDNHHHSLLLGGSPQYY